MEIITSKSNEAIRWIRGLQDQRRYRERERLFVVEGVRLLEEAAAVGCPVKFILHTGNLGNRERSVINRLARAGADVREASPPVLHSCSDTVTPQNVLAVLPLPSLPEPAPLEWAVIADAVTNPGNVGSLLRNADSFGVQAIYFAPGCADAFNPKAVRSAMGAHFRLPIYEADWKDIRERFAGFRILLAEARAGVRADQANWSGRVVLLVGGEASGPGDEARKLATESVHIPMRGDAESLNAAVAGGVLLYEAAKCRGLLG